MASHRVIPSIHFGSSGAQPSSAGLEITVSLLGNGLDLVLAPAVLGRLRDWSLSFGGGVHYCLGARLPSFVEACMPGREEGGVFPAARSANCCGGVVPIVVIGVSCFRSS